jgi:hypothetical protein
MARHFGVLAQLLDQLEGLPDGRFGSRPVVSRGGGSREQTASRRATISDGRRVE